jgi:hypothetical protein
VTAKPNNAAARAHARAAVTEREHGRMFLLECGHYLSKDTLMLFKQGSKWGCTEGCGYQRAQRRSVKHGEGRCEHGCAWCVDAPEELF